MELKRGRNGAVLAQKNKAEAHAFAESVRPALFAAMMCGRRNPNAVARKLNEQGVPAARGGKWYAQTVKRELARLGPEFADEVQQARMMGTSDEERAFYAGNPKLSRKAE